jgi:hypothetical protein
LHGVHMEGDGCFERADDLYIPWIRGHVSSDKYVTFILAIKTTFWLCLRGHNERTIETDVGLRYALYYITWDSTPALQAPCNATPNLHTYTLYRTINVYLYAPKACTQSMYVFMMHDTQISASPLNIASLTSLTTSARSPGPTSTTPLPLLPIRPVRPKR